jgi:hypothetical protein
VVGIDKASLKVKFRQLKAERAKALEAGGAMAPPSTRAHLAARFVVVRGAALPAPRVWPPARQNG